MQFFFPKSLTEIKKQEIMQYFFFNYENFRIFLDFLSSALFVLFDKAE